MFPNTIEIGHIKREVRDNFLPARKRVKDYSPQNTNRSTLLEGFKVPTVFTGATLYNGTVASDTTNFKTGANATAFTNTNGSYGSISKLVTKDFSAAKTFELQVYIPDVTVVSYIALYLYSGSKIAYYQHNISGNGAQFKNGWNTLVFAKSLMTFASGFLDANYATITKWEINVDPTSTNTPTTTFDSLKVDGKETSNFCFIFDAGYTSAYTIAKPLLDAAGIKATIAISAWTIDTAGFLTTAQVRDLYNNGWDVINQSYSHDAMDTDPYDANIKCVQDMQAWLISKGITRGVDDVFAYPSAYSDSAKLAISDLGFKIARDSTGKINYTTSPVDKLRLQAASVNNTTSLVTAKSYFDFCRYGGGTMMFYCHDLNASPASADWYTDRFTDLVAYAALAKSDVNFLTMTQYYDNLFK